MSGNFIYRHHVEPRVKFYSPREEPFRIPLKYIDVSRTTQTNLDVMQENRIIDPEDREFKETIGNARKIGNTIGSRYALQDMQEKQAWRDP